jgi:mannose-6-phosphate isomerase-like protein (cupin superfamily)
LPFGLSIDLHKHHYHHNDKTTIATTSNPPPYELYFIMSGQGCLLRPDGSLDPLSSGDAVLLTQGAGRCTAPPPFPPPPSPSSCNDDVDIDDWSVASLVVHIPRSLVDAVPVSTNIVDTNNDNINNTSIVQQQQQQQQQQHRDEAHRQSAIELVEKAWGNAVRVRHLPLHVAETILAGANDTAVQAASTVHIINREELDISENKANTNKEGEGAAAAALDYLSGILSKWLRKMYNNNNNNKGENGRDAPATTILQGVLKRTLTELTAFQLPNQTNRLALIFDPLAKPAVPFVFGIEIFEENHKTHPHNHPTAYELFFILSGEGEGFCDDVRFPVKAGDVVVFRPRSVHGIDNGQGRRMYCLELMLPNESFAEFVRGGRETGGLKQEDMCVIASIGCGGGNNNKNISGK